MKISTIFRSLLAVMLVANFATSSVSAMLRDGSYSPVTKAGVRSAVVRGGRAYWNMGGNQGEIQKPAILKQIARISDERAQFDKLTATQAAHADLIHAHDLRLAEHDDTMGRLEEIADRHEGMFRKVTRWVRGNTLLVTALIVGTVVVGYVIYNAVTGNTHAIQTVGEAVADLSKTVAEQGEKIAQHKTVLKAASDYIATTSQSTGSSRLWPWNWFGSR